MSRASSISAVNDISKTASIDLPAEPGIYAFWWVGRKKDLLNSNARMLVIGPGNKEVLIEFSDWWPASNPFPCLYIGKSTNIRKRFGLHLKRGSPGRLHEIPENSRKQKAVTTSCQLRYGIEHVFPKEPDPLGLIGNNVGFSYEVFPREAIAARFYREDLLIGLWKPWFNVDSER